MIAGLAFTAMIGGAIVWGRLREVDVPQVASWAGPVSVCAADRVADALVGEAVRRWREHGHDLVVGSERCDVVVVVEGGLDDRTGLRGGRMMRGRTFIEHDGDRMTQAVVQILPEGGLLALCHELGHALGYVHPRAAPTGHLLHPHAPSLDDWRGLSRSR